MAPSTPFDEVVTAPFKLAEYRTERTTEYTGRYTYWITGIGDDSRIAAKKIQLLGARDLWATSPSCCEPTRRETDTA